MASNFYLEQNLSGYEREILRLLQEIRSLTGNTSSTSTTSSTDISTATNQDEQTVILEELRNAIAAPLLQNLFNLLDNAIDKAEFSSADQLAVLGQIRENLRTIVNQFGAIRLSSEGILVDSSTTVQPVSAASLPLPSGASTEQTLQQIRDRITQSAATEATLAQVRDRITQNVATEATLADLNTKIATVNTDAVVVSSSTLPTGASTEATLAALRDRIPTSKGSGTVDVQTQRVTLASDGTFAQAFGLKDDAVASSDSANSGFLSLFKRLLSISIGNPTEAAPNTDTAVSGINGRLQRISTRITSLLSLLPTSLSDGRFKAEATILGDADDAPLTRNPVFFGGRATSSGTYLGSYADGDAVGAKFDRLTGGLLTHGRKMTPLDDEVRIFPAFESTDTPAIVTSTSTTYVRGAVIDLRGYNRVTFLPSVSTPGGTVGYYKVSWSIDATNWFDETVDALGAASGGEVTVTQNAMVRQFSSASIGIKGTSASTFDKRARYVSISQRSDSANTLSTSYFYQRS